MCDERRGDHADSNWLDSCRSYSSRFSGVWWELLAQFKHHHAVTVRNCPFIAVFCYYSVLLLQCSVTAVFCSPIEDCARLYKFNQHRMADFECVTKFYVRHFMNLKRRGPTDN